MPWRYTKDAREGSAESKVEGEEISHETKNYYGSGCDGIVFAHPDLWESTLSVFNLCDGHGRII